MKKLVIFYSKSGTTKKVGEEIADALKADTEEIIDLRNRSGPIGYLTAGRDAMKNIKTEIKELKNNPTKYDIIIIGTPIWGWTVTPAIRTLLSLYKTKKVAFFCTMGGSGHEKAFAEMEKLSSKPVATMHIKTAEMKDGSYKDKVKEFVGIIRKGKAR